MISCQQSQVCWILFRHCFSFSQFRSIYKKLICSTRSCYMRLHNWFNLLFCGKIENNSSLIESIISINASLLFILAIDRFSLASVTSCFISSDLRVPITLNKNLRSESLPGSRSGKKSSRSGHSCSYPQIFATDSSEYFGTLNVCDVVYLHSLDIYRIINRSPSFHPLSNFWKTQEINENKIATTIVLNKLLAI